MKFPLKKISCLLDTSNTHIHTYITHYTHTHIYIYIAPLVMLLYSHICRFTSTYMHIYMWNNSQRHNDKDARRKTHEGRRRKTSLQLYLPLTLFVRVRKGCSRFACERVLETEHKLHILTPLLWPSRCVFLFSSCSTGGLGLTLSGGFREPPRRVWPSLPHLVSSCLEFCWQLLWHPTQLNLYNNSTPTRSPNGSLKSNI